MTQSRRMSALEVGCSTAFGFLVAVAAQALLFPLFDLHATVATDFKLGAAFTVVSVVRSYVFRRLFNRWTR